jgi:hypothetical protein
MTLARRYRLTVYDAAYLELALREAVALATLDQALVAAARAEGVRIFDGLSSGGYFGRPAGGAEPFFDNSRLGDLNPCLADKPRCSGDLIPCSAN